MTMATCPEHGKYLVRIRLSEEENGTLQVSRLIYEGTSEAAQTYENRLAKKHAYQRSHKAKVKNEAD